MDSISYCNMLEYTEENIEGNTLVHTQNLVAQRLVVPILQLVFQDNIFVHMIVDITVMVVKNSIGEYMKGGTVVVLNVMEEVEMLEEGVRLVLVEEAQEGIVRETEEMI